MNIGTHLSIGKGYPNLVKDALSINSNTFQIFLGNPRNRRNQKINENQLIELNQLLKQHQFAPVLIHSPYIMNPCSPKSEVIELSLEIFKEDLRLMEFIPHNYYNLHPGSRLKTPLEPATRQIADFLNQVLTPEQSTIVLLETMSGKGSEVGRNFDELKLILDQVQLQDKVGICFDLCHLFDSGYDVKEHFHEVLKEFDEKIGLHKCKAFHINDSKNELGSHRDRHACMNEGNIGLDVIRQILSHPYCSQLPLILETPTDLIGHKKEVQLIQSLKEEL